MAPFRACTASTSCCLRASPDAMTSRGRPVRAAWAGGSHVATSSFSTQGSSRCPSRAGLGRPRRSRHLWAKGPLSHLSALAAAGLVAPSAGPLHVTVPVERSARAGPPVIAHRSKRRAVTIRCGRLAVHDPSRSLVDAWGWSHAPRRNSDAVNEAAVVRQAAIEGVRSGAFRSATLRAESDRAPAARRGGRRSRGLLDLVAGGCESELEIWGVRQSSPGRRRYRPGAATQVRLGDGSGSAWTPPTPSTRGGRAGRRGVPRQSARRGSGTCAAMTALAALGWVVLRFSYARLDGRPGGLPSRDRGRGPRRMAHTV